MGRVKVIVRLVRLRPHSLSIISSGCQILIF
jgi:hypothetical protein